MERDPIPTELKVEIIDVLSRSGLTEIEATSFVHPRVIPQMHDAARVMAEIERRPGVRYWALVPNLRGAERALAAGVTGVHFVVAATESYNQRNVGMTVGESINELGRIAAVVPSRVALAATLAVTFGCPFEGQPPDPIIVDLVRRLTDAGAAEVGLADTAGLCHPLLVRRVLRAVRELSPSLPLRLHLHDTRGLGLANAMAAIEEGVAAFDTAFGGLGGCPIMQGASGNIATEDFVNLCAEIGTATGVDLESVRAASRRIAEHLGRTLPSRVLAAGTRDELLALNRNAAG